MGLSSYTDVYTVPAYQDRVSDIQEAVASAKGGAFIVQARQMVNTQIENLRRKEQMLLSKINIPGVKTLEDLNQHLAKYRKATLNLSGAALYQTFVGVLEEKNAKDFDFFNKEVTAIIQNEILKGEDISNRSVQWAHEQVMTFLNQGLASSKGINTLYHSKKGFTDKGIFPASFTTSQKNKWKSIIAQRMASKGIGNGKWDVEVFTSSNTSMTASFNWFNTTQRMTQLEAQELERTSPQTITKINQQIKDAILSQTGDRALLGNIIDHILAQNKFAFFVGVNTKDITGILGEIQGLYYLSKLFGGENAAVMPAGLTWRGGTFTGGNSTKPHQDILFQQFGIQVKNSTKEAIDSINFANANLETMLSKTELSFEAKEIFKNYYGTKEFNVPYHREGNGEYVADIREEDKGAKEFMESRKALLNCEKDIDILLGMFAASFMYMDAAKKLGTQDANILYLVGGTAFYSAATILEQMLKNLEADARTMRFSSSITQGRNIIDTLNSRGDRGRGAEYSRAMSSQIKLSSSFNGF